MLTLIPVEMTPTLAGLPLPSLLAGPGHQSLHTWPEADGEADGEAWSGRCSDVTALDCSTMTSWAQVHGTKRIALAFEASFSTHCDCWALAPWPDHSVFSFLFVVVRLVVLTSHGLFEEPPSPPDPGTLPTVSPGNDDGTLTQPLLPTSKHL